MVDRWRDGSRRRLRRPQRAREGETAFKRTTASWFYRLFRRLADIDLTPESGDFRLMDRRALDALLAMPERNRFLRGMSVWVGFTQTAVTFEREAAQRPGGRSTRCGRMLRFSFDAITSFSYRPLQFATLLGFAFSALAFLAIPLTVVARYADIYERGVPSTIVVDPAARRDPADLRRDHRRVRRAHLRRGQAPAAVRRARPGEPREVRIAVIGAGVAGLVAAHRLTARRPRGRRLRALARARRPGRDARRRRRPPARALLPPPVHHRPPHRRALRRARDAGRARVAAVERRDVRARPPVAVHDAAGPAALRAAAAVRPRAHGRRRARAAAARATTRRRTSASPRASGSSGGWGSAAWREVWGPMLRGKFGARADDIAMVWLWNKLRLRRGEDAREEQLGYPAALVGAAVRGAAARDRGARRARADRPAGRRASRRASRSPRARPARSAPATTRARSTPAGAERYDRVLATVPNDVFERLGRAATGRLPRSCADRVLRRALPAARARPPVQRASTGPTSPTASCRSSG